MLPQGNVALMLPFVADTTSGAPVELDLTFALSNKIIDQIQAVYIDASNAGAAFTVTVQSTNQRVTCAAGRQGWFPLLVSYPNGGALSFSGGDALVPVFLTNVPMPVGTWEATDNAVGAAGWVSFSGLDTVGSTSSPLLPLDPTRSRSFVMIGAPATAALWVNRIGGIAGVGLIDCFEIPAGSIYENYPGESVWQAWTYFCATGGLPYTALAQSGV